MKHTAVVVCGNAGAGKTTYGQRLAAELSAALLDIDTVSERLVRVGLAGYGLDADDRDSPRYKALFREAIHDTLFAIAAENLQHTACVIVAPFTQERRFANWPEQLNQSLGVTPRIICLHCEEAERRRRILARANPRDQAKLEQWESYAAQGHDNGPPPFEHEWVDTTQGERALDIMEEREVDAGTGS